MGEKSFEVIIIGGGPAGLSAALWCKDLGIDALLIEAGSELGGQLNRTFNPVENYLGMAAANGAELLDKFVGQIMRRACEIKLDTSISNIDFEKKILVSVAGEEFRYKKLIIATGVRRRKLGIPGEEEFAGKGVLFSGKRDAEGVRGKAVAIVGGGDAALENVQILAEYASKIVLIHRRDEFRARKEFVEFATGNPMVEIKTNTSIKKISGAETVTAVELFDFATEQTSTAEIDAVLVRIGVAPNTALLLGNIDLDPSGYVLVGQNCLTSISSVYAVGDVANPISPTISTAVGTGSTAVKSLFS